MAAGVAVETRLVENARKGAEQLRPVLNSLQANIEIIVIEVDGVRFEVPGTVMKGVVDVLDAVAKDASPPVEEVSTAELTPQQAAGILRMSRPSVMRLVEKGLLRARLVGSHHRLCRAEVFSYKARSSAIRREALQNLVDLTEEYRL